MPGGKSAPIPHPAHRATADVPDEAEPGTQSSQQMQAASAQVQTEASRPPNAASGTSDFSGSANPDPADQPTLADAQGVSGQIAARAPADNPPEPEGLLTDDHHPSHVDRPIAGGPHAGHGPAPGMAPATLAPQPATSAVGGTPDASTLDGLQAPGGASHHLATHAPPTSDATIGALAMPPGGAAHPSPLTQISPALAALHSTPDGAHHVIVRLDPAELGQVEVRITRAQDGAASISVSVERPETLRSLQADLSHLHQALDRAGLPEQRSLSLQLASPDLGTASAGGGGQSGSQAGSQHQEAQARPLATSESEPPGISANLPPEPAPARWLRAGINITA